MLFFVTFALFWDFTKNAYRVFEIRFGYIIVCCTNVVASLLLFEYYYFCVIT